MLSLDPGCILKTAQHIITKLGTCMVTWRILLILTMCSDSQSYVPYYYENTDVHIAIDVATKDIKVKL